MGFSGPVHAEALLHHIASTPGAPVNLTTDFSCTEDVIPDPHVLCAYVDGVSPPKPFLSCTQNLGSSKEDQEGEDGGQVLLDFLLVRPRRQSIRGSDLGLHDGVPPFSPLCVGFLMMLVWIASRTERFCLLALLSNTVLDLFLVPSARRWVQLSQSLGFSFHACVTQ